MHIQLFKRKVEYRKERKKENVCQSNFETKKLVNL